MLYHFIHKRTYTSDADIYIIYFLMMHQKEFVISNIGGNPPTTTRLITLIALFHVIILYIEARLYM